MKNNNINERLFDELLRLEYGSFESEIAGLVASAEIIAQDDCVYLCTSRLATVHRLFKLWSKSAWADKLVILKKNKNEAAKSSKIKIKLSLPLYKEFTQYKASWPWLRGVMASCGMICMPKTGYYLSFRLQGDNKKLNAKTAMFLSNLNISTNARIKDSRWEIAIRAQQDIITLLAGMGLMSTALYLEEIAIIRALKDSVNKQVNCDAANIQKSLDAARRQLDTVDEIRSNRLWDGLPDNLKELALAREENPSLSLKELGQILRVPLSKSAVQYRLKKLMSYGQ